METIKIECIEEYVGQRIDKILVKVMDGYSRTQVQLLIQNKHIEVNGKIVKASYKLEENDVIIVHIPEPENTDIVAEDIPLDIVYEDSDMIVVLKPTGMIVHPSAGIYQGTLVNALLYHCQDLSGINGVNRPGIVHRIDKETSGLLMVAKNDMAHQSLSEQLQEHTVIRRYYALVHGLIPHEFGRIEAPIGRDIKDRQKMCCTDKNAKEAITNFKVIERFKDMTLVECRLETGRTHQIRVHMQYIGHPVYGDPQYGLRRDDTTYGQYLHAKILGFVHPRTKEEMYFDSELPEFFEKKLEELREEMK
ncbi:MAG: RluA family pseudouridine synthase [Erysipelotrichales bacterium]|nr:RluA family pseudouridine synthase [Erysipelotrichales bacterium]